MFGSIQEINENIDTMWISNIAQNRLRTPMTNHPRDL